MLGLRLPKRKLMSIGNSTTYLKPDKLYFKVDELSIKLDDKVKKGEQIGARGRFNVPVFSSVCGKVIDITDNVITIENDFSEETKYKENRKDIDKLTKDEFIDILSSCGIVGMGGAGFPTYLKYKTDTKIKTLIVNAVECEPYITADYTMVMEHIEELLETIDNILHINNIDEAIIGIKETNIDLIEKVSKYLGTYLRIKICEVPNKYPMGWERNLIKVAKKVEYDKLPIEKGIVVNNISTIYAIGEALKYNKPILERMVTFTGEGLYNPQNIMVKVGTRIDEVINHIGGTKKSINIISCGPMMGNLSNKELVITPEINCVLILPKEKKDYLGECLRCGKCSIYCPAGLSPVLIRSGINNIDKLKMLHPEKCISCGLCSYVCPSKLDVRESVNEAKDKLKEVK